MDENIDNSKLEVDPYWVAYYSDYSDIAIFSTEIEALRYAHGKSMEVILIHEGSLQDQVTEQWAARQTNG